MLTVFNFRLSTKSFQPFTNKDKGTSISVAFKKQGQVADIADIGAKTYTCVIWIINCQIAPTSLGSNISSFGDPSGILTRNISPLNRSSEAIGPSPLYWNVTLLVVVVSLLPYFLHLIVQRLFYPTDDQAIQEMKHCRKDSKDTEMWARELHNSRRTTQIGFSARVDAKISSLREQLHQKKTSLYKSVTSNPIFCYQTNI